MVVQYIRFGKDMCGNFENIFYALDFFISTNPSPLQQTPALLFNLK